MRLYACVRSCHAIADNLLCRSQAAETVREWLTRHLPDGPKPPIYRPLNWTRIITFVTGSLAIVSALSLAWPYLVPVLQNRNLWAALSLITILLFTSGHMFNHIRKVPYVAGDGKGGISYFAGGFSSQYGLETQIVAAMCKFSIRVPFSGNIHSRIPFELLMLFANLQPQCSAQLQFRQMQLSFFLKCWALRHT